MVIHQRKILACQVRLEHQSFVQCLDQFSSMSILSHYLLATSHVVEDGSSSEYIVLFGSTNVLAVGSPLDQNQLLGSSVALPETPVML